MDNLCLNSNLVDEFNPKYVKKMNCYYMYLMEDHIKQISLNESYHISGCTCYHWVYSQRPTFVILFLGSNLEEKLNYDAEYLTNKAPVCHLILLMSIQIVGT